jgi:hypothetical protein
MVFAMYAGALRMRYRLVAVQAEIDRLEAQIDGWTAPGGADGR